MIISRIKRVLTSISEETIDIVEKNEILGRQACDKEINGKLSNIVAFLMA